MSKVLRIPAVTLADSVRAWRAASVAAYFVKADQNTDEGRANLDEVVARLDRVEKLLVDLGAQRGVNEKEPFPGED